jgi:hypothetical protein
VRLPGRSLSPPDFAAAAKGKRTMSSLQDAVDVALANGKIAADASARAIREKLAILAADGAGYEFLFADRLNLIGKDTEDLRTLIAARIGEHKAKEAAKLEAERERIRAEEIKRLEHESETVKPAVTSASPAPAINVAPLIPRASASATSGLPTLRLGHINERLAHVQVTAAGLAALGFEPASRERSSVLYHESQFPLICDALVAHLRTVKQQLRAA